MCKEYKRPSQGLIDMMNGEDIKSYEPIYKENFDVYKEKEVIGHINLSYDNWIDVLNLKYKEPIKKQILMLVEMSIEYKDLWIEKFKEENDIINEICAL